MARALPPVIPPPERVRKTPPMVAGWIVRAVAECPDLSASRLVPVLGVHARQIQAARRELQRLQRLENH